MEVLDLPAGKPLSARRWCRAAALRSHGDGEQVLADLPFPDLRVGQAPGDRHAVGGGEQVELEAPVVAGVGGAVAVAGQTGQLGALTVSRELRTAPGWRPRAAAGRTTTVTRRRGSESRRPAAAPPPSTACGSPAGLADRGTGATAGSGRTAASGARRRRRAAPAPPPSRPAPRPRAAAADPDPAVLARHMVIDLYVECGQEGVQICRHKPILDTLLLFRDTTRPPAQLGIAHLDSSASRSTLRELELTSSSASFTGSCWWRRWRLLVSSLRIRTKGRSW